METRLIFIGDEFYSKSGTMMSSLYEEGTWGRYDWGFVARELGEGWRVTIRPASTKEMQHAKAMLSDLLLKEG